jgi:hypothetical protein
MVEKLASGEMVTRRRIGTFQIPPILSGGSLASSAPMATNAPAKKEARCSTGRNARLQRQKLASIK